MTELKFLLMLQSDHRNEDDAAKWVLSQFHDATTQKSNAGRVGVNLLEVWRNEDADETQSEDPKNGFMFYRFRVEFTPIFGETEEIRQVELARFILARAKEHGWECVVCANFEDQL